MGSVISGVMGGGGDSLLGAVGGIMGSIFGGPIGAMVGSAIGNAVQGAVGDATHQAADQLQKEDGMPKFLADEVKKTVSDALGECRNDDVDPATQESVDNDPDIKEWKDQFVEDMTKNLVEGVRKHLDTVRECSDGQGTEGASKNSKGAKGAPSTKSWLQAIASAMGDTLGSKAAKMVELSNKMSKLSSDGVDMKKKAEGLKGDAAKKAETEQAQNARDFTQTQTEMQAMSQEMSMLQNSFANAIKSIGEALSQMGRKG